MPLNIKSLKPYVPAKDFELSKRFYTALGFTMSDGWGGTADFSLDSHAFRLQDYYVQDWANNFMFTIGVDDVEAWHQRALDLPNSNSFPGMRVKAPESVGDSLVLHVLGSDRGSVSIRAVKEPRSAPNNSFKPTPLRGAA